jgi:hypothetical protein
MRDDGPWRVVAMATGAVLAVVLALLGLAVVGAVVLVYVGLNNFGSNK